MTLDEENVQEFLDAVANPHYFCEGKIAIWLPKSGHTNEPNCEVRDECQLFRSPGFERPIKPWLTGVQNSADRGCRSFQFLQDWKLGQKYWVVQFEGYEAQEAQGRDGLSAACAAWFELHRLGRGIDKMFLFDKLYTAKEA